MLVTSFMRNYCNAKCKRFTRVKSQAVHQPREAEDVSSKQLAEYQRVLLMRAHPACLLRPGHPLLPPLDHRHTSALPESGRSCVPEPF